MDTEVVEQSGARTAGGGGPVAGAEATAETSEATIDEVDRLLDDVEAALTRLDQGTYGSCSSCGVAIDDARLAADPTTRACAACDADDGPVYAVDRDADGETDERGSDDGPAYAVDRDADGETDERGADDPEDGTDPVPWAGRSPED
jgi:hypothetical protein